MPLRVAALLGASSFIEAARRRLGCASLLVCLFALWAAGASAQQPAAAHKDPFRGDTAFTDNARPPPLTGAENKDLKRVRSCAMEPPTIPHSVDNYQIDRFANKCMMCHSRVGAGESQATPISITHYTNRQGVFLADVDPRRYFCDTCHVVVDEEATARQGRKEEFRTWFFLTFVMAPVLAVAIVSAYGFAVWFYQLFVGPPGS